MLGPLVVGLNLLAIIQAVTISSQMPGWAIAISVAIPLLNVAFVFRAPLSSFIKSRSASETTSIFLRFWPVIMLVINGIFLLFIISSKLDQMMRFNIPILHIVFNLNFLTAVINFYYAYRAKVFKTIKSEIFYMKNRFEFGSILNRTFKIFALYPLIFLGFSAIFALTSIILLSFMPGSDLQDSGLGYMLLYWILSYICQGAISAVVYQALQGEKVNIGESVTMSLKRTPTLLMISFCCALCVILGLLLFVIPALIVIITFSVATPACVVEKLGAIKSINRSEELTKGNRLHILGLYMVLGLMCFFFNFLVGKLVILIKPPFFSIAEFLSFAEVLAHMAWLITSSIMITIIYHDLRNIREGTPIGTLTDVFD